MRINLVFSFLLFISSTLYSTNYVADYLELGIGGRPIGIGGCFVSVANDPTSTYWNPAGLSLPINMPQLFFMHTSLYKNMYKQDALYFKQRLKKYGLGIGFVMLTSDGIPFTKANRFLDWGTDHIPSTGDYGENNGVWDPGEEIIYDIELKKDSKNFLNAGFGYRVNDYLSIGISTKLIYENIGGYKCYGVGFDLGATYKWNEYTDFGISIRDIPSTYLHWTTGHNERKEPSIRLGGARKIELKWMRSELNCLAELEINFQKTTDGSIITSDILSIRPRLGGEIYMLKIFSVRAGYDGIEPTLGAGLKISYFALDYAYTNYEPGKNHRISLIFDIPSFKREKKVEKKIEIAQPVKEVVQKSPVKEEKISLQEKPIEPEKRVELDGIKIIPCFFETGKEEILPLYIDTLNSIGKLLKENEEYDIIILGHTDDIPVLRKYKDNYELSLARAKSVSRYLNENFGIPYSRMIIKGYGPDKPIAENTSNENRAKNRRVEIIFVKRR